VGRPDTDQRVRGWRRFADACRGRSPLYGRFATAIADDLEAGDHEVDDLLTAAPTRQLGHPTLLFAAVHDLLLSGGVEADELAAHYPSLGSVDRPGAPAGDPWPAFRRFCLEHRPAIEHRIRSRRTQTNEVGRSSLLALALRDVHRDVGRPLAWLDVGTSAGLALHLDRYHHDLGGGRTLGDPTSPVRLTCDVDGPAPTDVLPSFGWRAGLDASPVDVADASDRRWLEACVWPEQTDRLERLRAALDVARAAPVPVTSGDAVADLARACEEAPPDTHLVISHTWVLAYLTPEERAAFEAALDDIGSDRDLDRLGMEGANALPVDEAPAETTTGSRSLLLRSSWRDGHRDEVVAADVDDHGRWLSWRA
jgi:hypothetical protein